MHRIVVVGTIHEEQGQATVSALHSMLERISPDVIFLEIPVGAFPEFDEGARSTLESDAARKYREGRDVSLLPVDLPTPDEQFFRDFQYLERRVTRTNATYRSLVDRHTADVQAAGFAYLNSDRCRQAWVAIYEAMEASVHRLVHEPGLVDILARWQDTKSAREAAMLGKISAYVAQRHFKIGALLVGAAHVHPILDRSRNGLPGGELRFDAAD